MKTADFSYFLPNELIARYPTPNRTESRLLVVTPMGDIQHKQFHQVADYLKAGDVLVVNNTQVIAARLFGKKTTGGQLEILVERIESEYVVLAHVRSSRSPKAGALIDLYVDEAALSPSDYSATMLERQGALFRLQFSAPILDVMADIGHMPLPPYIDRADEKLDQSRYQTVYAEQPGAVAAPTAGLHFDDALITRLKAQGVDVAEVTLHVGAGTFQPVKVDNVDEHVMHSEWLCVSEEACEKIHKAKNAGGRVVAVGTTSVRSLETASASGVLQPYTGDTTIFIYPGYRFNCVDMLITNFHLPESTLLMLVSAFSGTETIRHAYQVAVKERYRFFSYGDAMLLFNAANEF
jgi:S-adenosylmethionine:tRNA ribosyltransferase-isomerase